jgi:hypothetical protein
MRQCGREVEMGAWIVSIGLNGSPLPGYHLLMAAEPMVEAHPPPIHPSSVPADVAYGWQVGVVSLPAPPPQFDLTCPSGSPALRTPPNIFGKFGECSITYFTVRLGLRRRTSAKADFASSILPSGA